MATRSPSWVGSQENLSQVVLLQFLVHLAVVSCKLYLDVYTIIAFQAAPALITAQRVSLAFMLSPLSQNNVFFACNLQVKQH